MIQRIQSLYLFIVLLLITAMFFLPFANFSLTGNAYCFNYLGIVNLQSNDLLVKILPIVILLILILIIGLFSIFRFKKRKFQIKLGKINIIFLAALVAIEVLSLHRIIYYFKAENFKCLFPLILPVISIILILLANKAIRKDEDLVRSVDRIR
ncbi:MAG: DUF4293 domain-containing protein [Bacteroidetes bacterium]|nr:DUF4293 domain-containing protein [Bacteroidota bacterium]